MCVLAQRFSQFTASLLPFTQLFSKISVYQSFPFARHFKEVKAFVFYVPNYPYDSLLGRKFMKQAKIQLDFDTSKTMWLGFVIPFHPQDYFQEKLKLDSILDHESI
jgi:hypothetical protein